MTKVMLAVGHGIKSDGTYDPGASGGSWTEQSAGDIIVAEAARFLTARGADIRSEANKNDPNYSGTIKAANAWPADIAVEVHHDWVGAPEGAFGHWYRADSKALADAIQKAVGTAGFLLRPSWHKRRTDLSFIKSTHMPSVLYEVGRISTGTLDTPEELRKMGQAIAQGIANHLGLYQVSAQAAKPEVVDVTKDQDTMLKQIRVSLVARSFDVDEIRAVMRNDTAGEISITDARAKAVASEKKRLGL